MHEQFRTVASVREHGDYLIERQQLFGVTWVTVDRYKTADLTAEPAMKDRPNGRKLRRDGKDEWIKAAVAALSQSPENIQIEVPPVPPLEEGIFEICQLQHEGLRQAVEQISAMNARLEQQCASPSGS